MPPKDYTTISEYAKAQKEMGSCLPEFRATVIKSLQAGAIVGVPFGSYVAYRQHRFQPKAFFGKSLATWITCTVAFACMGLMSGTYNCLRVKM